MRKHFDPDNRPWCQQEASCDAILLSEDLLVSHQRVSGFLERGVDLWAGPVTCVKVWGTSGGGPLDCSESRQ